MMPQEHVSHSLLPLHRRLLEGEPAASEQLVGALLSSLVTQLQRQFPAVDTHLVSEGVTDALLEYCHKPGAFDANSGLSLERFVARAAWRNIANSLRRERRRRLREAKTADFFDKSVEVPPPAGNIPWKENLEDRPQLEALAQALTSPADIEILELRARGERRTEVFAETLGISHLPVGEQRRQVKRAKDRIDKQLRRRKTVK